MLSVTRVSRLSLIVAALGLCLVAPALAQTVTITDIVRNFSDDAVMTVPTVEITDASIGEDEVRALFGAEEFNSIADTLGTLVARSVLIPEIRIEQPAPEGEEPKNAIIISNLEFGDVAHGLAGSLAVGDASLVFDNGTSIEFGTFTVTDLNMGYLFALFDTFAEPQDQRALDSVWSAMSLGASTFTGPDGSCSTAGIDAGALQVRVPEYTILSNFFELLDKAKENQAAAEAATDAADKDRKMDVVADDAARLQSHYYDLFNSYSAGPMTFGGIACDVTGANGDPVAFSIDSVEVGEARPGTLPDVMATGLAIENSGADAGTMSIESLHVLPTDYAAVVALFPTAGEGVDRIWLSNNQRRLVPSFGGFEIGGLVMDLPNSSNTATPNARIVGSIGSVSALFDSYINGLPTDIRSSATDVNFELPQDASSQMLTALGLDPLTVSYDLSARWDRATREIVVDNLMLSADNGGTVILSGVIGNATPALFGTDMSAMNDATKELTIKELNVYVGDAGLLEKGIAVAAQQQNADPAQFRTALAGMTQGMVLLGLGATPDAMEVAGAISAFLGNGGELSLSAVALSHAGVNIYEMQKSGSDPTQILKQFALTVGSTPGPDAGNTVPAEETDADDAAAGEPTAPETAAPATAGDTKTKSK